MGLELSTSPPLKSLKLTKIGNDNVWLGKS